jgi:hypothetical protein
VRGYNNGYDECSGQESQSSDDDEASGFRSNISSENGFYSI